MKSEGIEMDTDRRNWIPDYLSDQWFEGIEMDTDRRNWIPDYLSDQWFGLINGLVYMPLLNVPLACFLGMRSRRERATAERRRAAGLLRRPWNVLSAAVSITGPHPP
jgi:hypothetical protein